MLREFCLLLPGSVVITAIAAGSPPRKRTNAPQIERGNYLANGVAGCGDCHSPRLHNGAPDKAHWLEGTPLFFSPVHPIPNWATRSPDIAGLQFWKPEDVVKLLETGAFPDGKHPNPPMPAYHMTARDAQAVVAYLKSLGDKH